jgi:antitoxin (DNA-binding transcriptional repressor) of toxin-antitoxin stability system
MKAMPVGEVKAHFSEVLEEVKHGNGIGILYGRTKKTVAMIVPYIEEKISRRKIGILDGKMSLPAASAQTSLRSPTGAVSCKR